ncbi:GDP-Man:Man(3)GlcNAc(2)-PP-Dol alpha-1,2-mannosyltransferase-like isoform X2 [Babylonia areolata]|uniref:GDP-Man:Man(3)GlcNAc(2)-PP-Dol alpha-1,2-mannosyltransferase-like isoform X2 n=1 Tax=Babylonia areolata TaxID=304850 RepID=UPI003FD51DB9
MQVEEVKECCGQPFVQYSQVFTFRYPKVQCVVYTGDIDASPQEILTRARQRFNISLKRQVEFVFLKRRKWVEASKYPCFTLLGQSLGSLVLGFEALLSYIPDVYIDSMGYSFTLPLFRFFGRCKVACYVHYPTISTDMLEKVSQRSSGHNNLAFIANSVLLSSIKLFYYRLFAYLYGVMGKQSQVVMVNSSWTLGHIRQLWKVPTRTHVVYPPCDVSEFVSIPLSQLDSVSEKNIISVGQFRPEKDHALMVRSFKMFLDGEGEPSEYKLLLVGGCRNQGDVQRVQELKELAASLGVTDNVVFHLNVDFDELKRLLASSVIGLHAMWNEHFGIGVVECMAAGNVMLAHDSGGPKLDIVVPHDGAPTGFLASSEPQYAQAMASIFSMTRAQRLTLRQNARESAKRFSEHEFEVSFLACVETLLPECYGQGDR